MHTDSENYKRYVNARAKKSPLAKNCVRAFLTGGAICAGAQGLLTLYKSRGMEKDDAAALVSVSLVFLTALLTGLGVFDNIAKWAGAGTLVPITGFANAVSAPAIDTKGEGFVLGVGAKIFSIAGPVILYGMAAGTVYGVIYWIIQTFF
ncbi:MAG: SpoVA/SpoVAEb family sporulation membrane protein [Clostridia bacterium]|jgi:stage V sporulation protein AC|nr:SpoVA/SpoVAEb family sporulation membrane protein [Clostridia bacterium]